MKASISISGSILSSALLIGSFLSTEIVLIAAGQQLGFQCDDDTTATITMGSRKRTCGFLASKNEKVIANKCKRKSTGAAEFCRETCGLCSDACVNIPNATFIYDRRTRPCSWLALYPGVKSEVCKPGQDAYDECPETCDRCDTSLFVAFQPIHINVGGGVFTDSAGTKWQADRYMEGGRKFFTPVEILNVGRKDAPLYRTERWGANMMYSIPVPNGDYSLTLYFAEIDSKVRTVERVFNVSINDRVEFSFLNVATEAGGLFMPLEKSISVRVEDQKLDITFDRIELDPKLSGISINLLGKRAFAVPSGPFFGVDAAGDGNGNARVDGSLSYTVTPDAVIRFAQWTWLSDKGPVLVGKSLVTTINLPVGEHTVRLEVIDTDGHYGSKGTTVTIKEFGVPFISSMVPTSGTFEGGEKVVLHGSGFSYDENRTVVHFGLTNLTGFSMIKVINSTAIEFFSPPGTSPLDEVTVRVETPVSSSITEIEFRSGEALTEASNEVMFRYFFSPVNWTTGTILEGVDGPTCVAFGPDLKLYVGTTGGIVYKLSLDSQFNIVHSVTSDVVNRNNPNPPNKDIPTRAVLGIAFDPTDTSGDPVVYVSHSWMFHGVRKGYYFGKVSRLSGQNLTVYEDVITGLPVSDYSHAVNGLEFGDNGELYIQNGGMTNAGIGGGLSIVGHRQPEEVLSAATLIAHNVTLPEFNGSITYDSKTREPVTGLDVRVFASGQRNSFDILLHSNGNLYATDNGPNKGFGKESVNCKKRGPDPDHGDKLNLIVEGGYYGHANRKRGKSDSRQCRFRDRNETSRNGYTTRIVDLPSSSNGIMEFQTDHFGGALRGRLLVGQWGGPVFDIALNDDGLSASDPSVLLESGGLNLVQAPDGTIVVSQHWEMKVIFYKPMEVPWSGLQLKGVFPHRGSEQGKSTLSVYGENFDKFGTLTITLGGEACEIIGIITATRLSCTLPPGIGTVDVTISASSLTGVESDVLVGGYRYIRGPPVDSLEDEAIDVSNLVEKNWVNITNTIEQTHTGREHSTSTPVDDGNSI